VSLVAPDTADHVDPPSVETCHWTDVAFDAPAVNEAPVPATTVSPDGLAVTDGAASTVSVAAVVVAVEPSSENTARYSLPDSPVVVEAIASVSLVAPDTPDHVDPPSVETCHCTDVAFDAPAVNEAPVPAATVSLDGLAVTAGAASTVNVAAVVVAVEPSSENTARYSLPDSLVVVEASVSVSLVAPDTLDHVVPPSVETCHWTEVAFDAEALKEAPVPATTVSLDGLAVTDGAASTVNVAAVVVAVEPSSENTARYSLPDSLVVVEASVRVSLVAPDTPDHVEPPSVETCHWTEVAFDAEALNEAPVPATTVSLDGSPVTTGAANTVNVAADVSVVTPSSENSARYSLPDSPNVASAMASVSLVAPDTPDHVDPPSVETCHCTDVAFDAEALNEAPVPATTVSLDGLPVTTGATADTVNVAAVVVAVEPSSENTARYSLPDSPSVASLIVSVSLVAPDTADHVDPPSVETCHCTDVAFAAEALNVALCPAVTDWSTGF
jgi:hypothetical protein